MKYWGQIREQIRMILIYGEFPRITLLLLTKPNIHPFLSELTGPRDTILTQGGLGGRGEGASMYGLKGNKIKGLKQSVNFKTTYITNTL